MFLKPPWLTAVEWAAKSKPYTAAVCRTAIPLRARAGSPSHSRGGTRLFHWPHQTPSSHAVRRAHRVLQVFFFGISHQSALMSSPHICSLSVAFSTSELPFKMFSIITPCVLTCHTGQSLGDLSCEAFPSCHRDDGGAKSGQPGVCVRITAIPHCNKAESSSALQQSWEKVAHDKTLLLAFGHSYWCAAVGKGERWGVGVLAFARLIREGPSHTLNHAN